MVVELVVVAATVVAVVAVVAVAAVNLVAVVVAMSLARLSVPWSCPLTCRFAHTHA